MRLHNYKQILAGLLDFGIADRMIRSQLKADLPFVRAVNYHGTPERFKDRFERQLRYFSKHFAPVTQLDLVGLRNGEWKHERPGLLISFDDGLASNATIAAPLLEKYGFVGWFFVPSAFPDVPVKEQLEFSKRQLIDTRFKPDVGERIAMTWDEIRKLEENHVVGCHTLNHVRLRKELSENALRQEITTAKQVMETKLGHEVESFCWVGGQQDDYSQSAARIIKESGFKFSFMTNSKPIRPGYDPLQLQRTHIESDWELPLVKLQLTGLIDRKYRKKRQHINALTSV